MTYVATWYRDGHAHTATGSRAQVATLAEYLLRVYRVTADVRLGGKS